MSKRFSLKELKSPDKFFKVMLKFVTYLRSNVKAYLVFSAVVVSITLAYVIINNVSEKRENKARTILFNLSLSMKDMTSENPDDYIKKIEAELDKLGSTDAGMEARYMLAELYYNKKDWDKALSYYSYVSGHISGLLQELSIMGEAYSLENKGDTKGALDKFQELRDATPSVYKAVSLLGIGRCYKKIGDKGKALSAYESVIVSYPDTDYARMASIEKVGL